MKKSDLVENLDCMEPEELRDYAAQLRILSDYGNCKASAMEFRAKGFIAQALKLELHCDALYLTLPENLRW